jgi:hypothetical protein
MRRMWLFLVVIVILSGCVSDKAYEAEKSYYDAMKAVLTANGGQENPILKIEAKDPEKDMVFQNVASITVFTPPLPQNGPLIPQYKHETYAQWIPAVTGLGTAAIGVGGIWGVTHELGKWAMGTTYNMMGAGSSVKVQGGTTANISGGTMGSVGATDATSTPTVVTQPAPIVVNQPEPVVVNPVVVQ